MVVLEVAKAVAQNLLGLKKGTNQATAAFVAQKLVSEYHRRGHDDFLYGGTQAGERVSDLRRHARGAKVFKRAFQTTAVRRSRFAAVRRSRRPARRRNRFSRPRRTYTRRPIGRRYRRQPRRYSKRFLTRY